jgi:hypothetical protein
MVVIRNFEDQVPLFHARFSNKKKEIQKFGSLEHIEVFKVLRTSCWSFVLLFVKRQAYETFSLLDFEFFSDFACYTKSRSYGREGRRAR